MEKKYNLSIKEGLCFGISLACFIFQKSSGISRNSHASPKVYHAKKIGKSTLREKCPYSELFWSVSSRIWTYSVRVRENTDQNNSEYGHHLRSEDFVFVNSFSASAFLSQLATLFKEKLQHWCCSVGFAKLFTNTEHRRPTAFEQKEITQSCTLLKSKQ